MKKILEEREKLSAIWHSHQSVWSEISNFTFHSDDRYLAFCASKDWIQDTAETLLRHREVGFSNEPTKSYLEFWGVLQAIFVLQDAIQEMHYSLTGKSRLPNEFTDGGRIWHRLRNLRNDAVGHPTRRGRSPVKRCVTGRQPKSYLSITLTFYEVGSVWNENLRLGQLLDDFDLEASAMLSTLSGMLARQLERHSPK